MGTSPNTSNNRVATALAAVITTVWAISFLVDIVARNYDPPASIHALMMIVAGAVFGEGLIKSRTGGPPSRKERDDE